MLKLYIFWGTFALVLIGVALTLLSQHNRRQKNRAAERKADAAVTPDTPPAAAIEAPYDPSATRIHVRTAPASESAAQLDRENAVLPAGASVKLVCVGGAQKGDSFHVRAGGITVGRDSKNDIVIADPRVSYHHAWIGIVDHKVVLRDLESTNGTFLNAQLDSLVHEVALIDGDTIFFGGHGGAQFRLVVD